ncbi:hypothetical protein ACFL7E_04185 [Thermodesulfobacteriota bacterium]
MTTKRDYFEQAKDSATDIEKAKCSNCNRELGSPNKWIGDQNSVLCEGCYQDLAFPFFNNTYELRLT